MGEVIGAPLSILITIQAATIWGKLFLSQGFFIGCINFGTLTDLLVCSFS